jgi:hypothetical protein
MPRRKSGPGLVIRQRLYKLTRRPTPMVENPAARCRKDPSPDITYALGVTIMAGEAAIGDWSN